MTNLIKRQAATRRRRTLRVRRKVRGDQARPRLSVFRSLKNISVQVIDDEQGRTLAAASSLEKSLKGDLTGKNKTDIASRIGKEIAERAKAAGVSSVSFDRGSYKYHGRIKALADAAREGGLQF